MENPRFPHTIRITRVDTTVPYDPFNPTTPTTIEVYYGEGRNYKNNKTGAVNGVIQSDYAVSIPFTEIDIMTGDTITVTERTRTLTGMVDDPYLGNLGLTVYWNKVNN